MGKFDDMYKKVTSMFEPKVRMTVSETEKNKMEEAGFVTQAQLQNDDGTFTLTGYIDKENIPSVASVFGKSGEDFMKDNTVSMKMSGAGPEEKLDRE